MTQVDEELWREVQAGDVSAKVTDKIGAAVAELRETRAGLVALRERVQTAARGLGQEIARIDRLLKAAGTSEAKPKTNGQSRRVRVSDETIESVYAAINSISLGHSLTVLEIASATGRSRSAVQTAIGVLREQGRVRLVGERPQETGGGRGLRLYAPMTAEGENDGDGG